MMFENSQFKSDVFTMFNKLLFIKTLELSNVSELEKSINKLSKALAQLVSRILFEYILTGSIIGSIISICN